MQDTGRRADIDRADEGLEYEAFAAEELAKQETARQWRIAKGEASFEDLQGPIKASRPVREEWITALPEPSRKAATTQISQVGEAFGAECVWHGRQALLTCFQTL